MRRRVDGLQETPSLLEQPGPLRVENAEDVEKQFDLDAAEVDRVVDVHIDVVVARRATLRAALGEEKFVPAVGIGEAVAREGRAAPPVRGAAEVELPWGR